MKRGVNKKVSKYQDLEQAVELHNKKFFQLAVFAFFAATLLLTAAYFNNATVTGYASGDTDAANGASEGVQKVIQIVIGNPFQRDYSPGFLSNNILGTTGVYIIHIMVWLILFFTFSYIFGNFLFFSKDPKWKWVPWISGFALAIIVSLLGVTAKIVTIMASATAIFAGAGVFVAMGIAVVFFVIITFLRNLLRKRMLKKAIKEAEEGGEETASAIKNLRKAYRAFGSQGST